MGVHIQVRDVPDAVFLALKARAAGSGRTLSEFLRGLLEDAVTPAGPVPVGAVGPVGPAATVIAPRLPDVSVARD
jgi:plasmid stability protein